MEMSSEATIPQDGAASRGPTPRCGVEPPASISNSSSSHDFSYLVKTKKVRAEKFNVNFF
jgi:hypothetical protein